MKGRWAFILFFILISRLGFAMDSELLRIPKFPQSVVLWEDKILQVNGIIASSTQLRCQAASKEVIEFYRQQLPKIGWKEYKYYSYPYQGIYAFIKDHKFLYLAVTYSGKSTSTQIYFVSSSEELEICKMISLWLGQPQIAPDTDGKDFPDFPRYPGSKRRFNVFTPGYGAAIMYEADAQPQEIVRFYRVSLILSGWSEENIFSRQQMSKLREDNTKDLNILMFRKPQEQVVIYTSYLPLQLTDKNMLNKRSLIIITRNIKQFIGFPLERSK